jgi:alpha-galactosidase
MKQPDKGAFTRRRLIQNGLLLTAGGISGTKWLFGGAVAGAGTFISDAGSRSWTVGNDQITRTVSFHPTLGFYTERFSDLSTRADFIVPDKLSMGMAQEFSFVCNGNAYAGTKSGFTLLNASETKLANGNGLTVQLRHEEIPLQISVVYSVYDGHPAVRKHLVLQNTGSSPLSFTHLNIEALGISLGPENETTLLTQYGTIPREIFYTGRSEDAGLLLANAPGGTGLAILSEVPGYMKRTEIAGWDDAEKVRIGVLYDTDLMPFERTLAGGEEFKTASVSLVTFRNGDGFHDPHWVLPSYTAEVLVRRVNVQGPPWIYNTWEPFERGINRDIALELIDVASTIGMEIFTIDDGWQQEYGENAVNLTSFPGGLKPILDVVEAKGMRLGLWIPLAAIGPTTADYRAHPEWACRDMQGKLKVTGTMGGSKVVMCLASGYRDLAAARVNDAISRFHLAYVKLDITTIFNAYGEAPGCYAEGHDHGSWAESLNMIYEGITYVTGKIYEKHPDVLLDLTFEVWGQKHIIGAGLLAAGDLDWMSNVDDTRPDSAGPLQARQLLYQRAASMPVESMLIGNLHAELPTVEESFATAIGSAPLLLGDLRKLSVTDRQWYHEKILWFKNLRRKTRISESFFPLGSWLQPESTQWDGFARLAHSGDGVIVIFRNRSKAAMVSVALPLMPPGKFKVRSVITGKEPSAFTSAEWARGIQITFSAAPVEILEVTSISA